MAVVDLSSYRTIETALFVKIEIPGNPTIYVSDYKESLVVAGDTYAGIGYLMGITDTSSELRLNNAELTVTLSMIPLASVSDFIAQPIKGSKVTIIRGIFDPVTHTMLAISGNPTGKFKGIINNYGINETQDGRNETCSINLICKSQVGMVSTRQAGRRTNPSDEKIYFPLDQSMDRVPSLSNAKINFGGI